MEEVRIVAVTGPDFISLQVRDLERSAAFYERYLGLKRSRSRTCSETKSGPVTAMILASCDMSVF